MGAKHLLFDAHARDAVLRGATALADAVRVTLGPKSKCVLIGRKWDRPLVCNDGVTIAKEMELADPEEDLGVRMMRQAAERTGEAVGDGTTTSTLLAHAMFAEGVRNVAAGASAIDVKRGMDGALQAAVASLHAQSRSIASHREKVQVATISAHNDPRIGELVAEAVEKVGGDGVISVEEAKGTETTLEVVDGLQFDDGYLSPYFITDAERMECVLEDCLVLLATRRIQAMKDFLPILEQVVKLGRPLLVVAEDVEGEALATRVVNKVRGPLPCAAVKAPGFGDRRKAMLEDVAVLTGGRVASDELGVKLDHVTADMLGRARRVVVGRDRTVLIGGAGDKAAIAARVEQLRSQIGETKSDYDREKLEERLGKLSGGVAVIRVGALTEAELKSRKEAFDDAISATRAAVAEGVVPGAGLALLRCIPALEREEASAPGDERTGFEVVKHALSVPTRQIAINSGADAAVVVDAMRAAPGNQGFDAATGRYVDLVDAGIIDPTKVVRLALENAASVAGPLLLTDATMTEVTERRRAPEAAETPM